MDDLAAPKSKPPSNRLTDLVWTAIQLPAVYIKLVSGFAKPNARRERSI